MGKFIYSTPNRAPVPANPARERFLQKAAPQARFFIFRLVKGELLHFAIFDAF